MSQVEISPHSVPLSGSPGSNAESAAMGAVAAGLAAIPGMTKQAVAGMLGTSKASSYGKSKTSDVEGPGDKLAPGTGSIGSKGTALLIDYENLGEDYKVYESGKLVAILSRDVEGKGNITYGYGVLFKNTPEERKRLKDIYGLEFAEKTRVPIAICEKMYQDYVNENLPALYKFTNDDQIWLNQNQLDALIMHRHLTYRLGSKTQDALIEMFKNNDANDPNLKKLYWDKLFDAMLGDLKNTVNEADYKIYEDGWKNRILDELELFFDGDEKRNH
ncbi:hypothetical protein ABFV83_12375 [Lacrimispora sp. BS-2]|uniref:Uncharacterized protein n=1 Tax=Lacrimispora sp. BS-2 TaxID=3151850 RepID=A0AAU7PKC0_9FIRM